MKNRLHHYPDEAALHHHPPHQGAFVVVGSRVGRFVGITGSHLWVTWSLNKSIYQMMRCVFNSVVARDYGVGVMPDHPQPYQGATP